MFQNYYFGGASECVVDKQGRILIPPLVEEIRRTEARCRSGLSFRKVSRLGSRCMEKIFSDAEEKLMQDPDFLGDLGL